MRVAFMGTPEFAVPCLRALYDAGYEIVGVVSQPDRPKGRGYHLEPTPVAALARALGLPLFQPAKVNDPAFIEELRALAPEIIVVVAFGQILRKALLDIPPIGCVNVHASLLPRHRGGSPIQHTLLAGDKVTGVTTMLMDEGMDTGPMLLQEEMPVAPEDTTGTLFERLSLLGAKMLLETIPALATGRLEPVPQDAARATYAPNLKREDARLAWGRPAARLRHQVRAFAPRPGAWAMHANREIKVWRASVDGRQTEASPGQVLEVTPRGVLVSTGEGALWLEEVQEAGKARMPADAFARGARLGPGQLVD